MAEGFLRSFDTRLEVASAGTKPAARVHPLAVDVMGEIGVDLSGAHPKHVDQFLGEPFDFVITVCGNADQACPPFLGSVGRRVHIGFDDPAEWPTVGEFRRVRDEIRERLRAFYEQEIRNLL